MKDLDTVLQSHVFGFDKETVMCGLFCCTNIKRGFLGTTEKITATDILFLKPKKYQYKNYIKPEV